MVSGIPRGLPIYLKVCGSEIPYTGIVDVVLLEGVPTGLQGFPTRQGETMCSSCMYSSPTTVLPIK
jgi:hypothetical protein